MDKTEKLCQGGGRFTFVLLPPCLHKMMFHDEQDVVHLDGVRCCTTKGPSLDPNRCVAKEG